MNMDLSTAIYFVSIADNVRASLAFLSGVCFVFAIVCGIVFAIFMENRYSDSNPIKCRRWVTAQWAASFCVVAVVLGSTISLVRMLTPNTQGAAAILGISAASKIDGIENLAPNAVKGLNKLLESYIKEVPNAN